MDSLLFWKWSTSTVLLNTTCSCLLISQVLLLQFLCNKSSTSFAVFDYLFLSFNKSSTSFQNLFGGKEFSVTTGPDDSKSPAIYGDIMPFPKSKISLEERSFQ